MQLLKNNWSFFAYTAIIGLIYYAVDFQHLLFMRPMGEHAWAQIDRASVALQYYQQNANFFFPQTHNIAGNPSAIACGEFPLQPCLVSLLYRNFGFHEYLFRLFVLFCSISGFFFSYMISRRLIANQFLAFLAATFWILSPNLIYYSTGFVPDTLALTLLMIGFYFLIRNFPDFTVGNLSAFAFFSTFGILEKFSVVLIYLPLCTALIFHFIRRNSDFLTVFKKAGFLVLPLAIAGSWIVYASWLQHHFHSNIYLLKPRFPQSLQEFFSFIKGFAGKITDFYSVSVLILFCGLLICIFKNFRSTPVFFKALICGLMASWVLFFISLSRQAWFHGYYHIPFQFIIFIILITAFYLLDKQITSVRFSYVLYFVLALTFVDSIYNINNYFKSRAWHYDLINKDWMDADQALQKMGVSKNSSVITCSDHSYNISLYLMNRRGWNLESDSRDDYIEQALKACDYMVLTNNDLLKRKVVIPYTGVYLGQHRSLLIYKIKHSR